MTKELTTTGKKKNQEMTVHESMPIVPDSADSLISQAIAIGSNIDVLERLMVLRKDMLAEKAKEAFNAAMAAFQSECPVIKKTKGGGKTKSGAIAYYYAPIESIVEQVKELLQKHGFRYLVTMEFNGTNVKAICRVVHTFGHEEISIFEVPLGTKTEIMSQTQVVAAASTFAKRYAFLNAFGIMTGDEDNDAAKVEEAQRKSPVTPVHSQLTPTKAEPAIRKIVQKPPKAPTVIRVMEAFTEAETQERLQELFLASQKYEFSAEDKVKIEECYKAGLKKFIKDDSKNITMVLEYQN